MKFFLGQTFSLWLYVSLYIAARRGEDLERPLCILAIIQAIVTGVAFGMALK